MATSKVYVSYLGWTDAEISRDGVCTVEILSPPEMTAPSKSYLYLRGRLGQETHISSSSSSLDLDKKAPFPLLHPYPKTPTIQKVCKNPFVQVSSFLEVRAGRQIISWSPLWGWCTLYRINPTTHYLAIHRTAALTRKQALIDIRVDEGVTPPYFKFDWVKLPLLFYAHPQTGRL